MFLVAVSASASGPAWSALFIAIAGLVLSGIALGWQIIVFVKSGSRIRIEMKFGAFFRQNPVGFLLPEAMQGMPDADDVLGPAYVPNKSALTTEVQNIRMLWLIAEISNVGRLPVTVQACEWHTAGGEVIGLTVKSPGVSFPHRLDVHDQCIAVIDLDAIINLLDAPFAATITSGREVWPVVRLGNRRTVKGRRSRIPITSDPSQRELISDEDPGLPFKLIVNSASSLWHHELGSRSWIRGVLVEGYIVQGAVRLGDKVELISPLAVDPPELRVGECIGVGKLSQSKYVGTSRCTGNSLVGVLVRGLKAMDVRPADVLQGVGAAR